MVAEAAKQRAENKVLSGDKLEQRILTDEDLNLSQGLSPEESALNAARAADRVRRMELLLESERSGSGC